MVLNFCIFALALGQNAAPPPAPAGEAALRSQVTAFYDAFVEGKYRKAFALVAEDSQDHFLGMGKLEMEAFRIQRIELTGDGMNANVAIEVDTQFRFSGQSVPVKRQLESTWKIEEGEWRWYFVPPKQVRTPFGMVTVDPDARKRQVDLKEQIAKGASAGDLMSGLQVTPREVTFAPNEPGRQEFTVTNGLKGWINLSVIVPKVKGLGVPVFEQPLGPGASRTIRLEWAPGTVPPADAVEFVIQASPIGGAQIVMVRWQAK